MKYSDHQRLKVDRLDAVVVGEVEDNPQNKKPAPEWNDNKLYIQDP